MQSDFDIICYLRPKRLFFGIWFSADYLSDEKLKTKLFQFITSRRTALRWLSAPKSFASALESISSGLWVKVESKSPMVNSSQFYAATTEPIAISWFMVGHEVLGSLLSGDG